MNAMHSGVELSRQFFPLSANSDAGLDQQVAMARANGQLKSWSDLTERRSAVVLGEAGCGKTTEFKRHADRLVREGKTAFFIPLKDLANQDLRGALGAREEKLLESWIEGDSHGTFLFDAFDEAQLDRLTLALALKKFGKGIGGAAFRSSIVISCRVSDWDLHVDQPALVDHMRSLRDPTALSEVVADWG